MRGKRHDDTTRTVYAHRTYSDEERATALAALAANGGNVALTARQIGLADSTLRKWAAGRVPPGVAQKGEQKKKDLAASLEAVAYQLVDALPAKIKDASLQQAATSLAIAIDKMQLLRGRPTAITQAEAYSADERADRVVSLLDTARKRRLTATG